MSTPSNKAASAAAQASADNQQQVAGATAAIQNAYGSNARQAQYQTYAQNLQKYYNTQIQQQQNIANQNLKFSLARSGLNGGSQAAYAGGVEAKDAATASLNAENQVESATANLKQSDVNSENSLIALAQNGLSTGNAATQIAQSQQANLNNAQSAANPTALGNLFQNTAGIYQTEQTANAQRQAAQLSPYGGIYGTSAFG
jgi:hypothetical protein